MNNLNGSNALRKINYIPANDEKANKLKVAVYVRVSTKSDEQLHSYGTQFAYYKNLIENEENFEMVDIYADEGISGTNIEKRIEFQRMIIDAKNGKIDRIITKSISRFARNTIDSIITVRELKSHGVSVLFEKESIDTDKLSGENILTLYSILSERESLSISQTCKKGIRMKMSAGQYALTNIAYGYRKDGNELKIYEPEAEIVRRIYKEFLQGAGAMTIARKLNEDEIPRKDGIVKWRKQSIYIILRNEKYIGDTRCQKTFAEDIAPFKRRVNRGELERYYIENTHEPIVSKVEFELANIILREKSTEVEKRNKEYNLTGKIECECCQSKLRVKTCSGKVYWLCRNIHEAVGENPCQAKAVEEKEIHIAFINMMNKLKRNVQYILEPIVLDYEKLEEKKYRNSEELKKVNKELAELSEQNLTMTGLVTDGVLDSAIFMPKINDIKNKINDLKLQKSIILRNSSNNEIIEKTKILIRTIKDTDEFLTDVDMDLFEKVVKKVTYKDGKSIKFHLVNGFVVDERKKND